MTWWTRLTGVCAVAVLLATVITPASVIAAGQEARSGNIANTHIRSPQTFFAYLAPGQNLDASFVKTTDNTGASVRDVTITVRRPGAAPLTCLVPDTLPVGSGCYFPDLTGGAGIWSVDFAMSCAPATFCSGDKFDWDVTVQSGATDVPGRVWTEKYALNQGATEVPVDLSFWYQSEFGYTYQGNYRQYNGIDSTVAADNFGVVQTGTCTPAYQSSANLQVAGGTCGGVFKVFFEPPANDLPVSATRWDGATDWIKPPVAPDPTITNATFTPDAPGSRSGALTFDLNDYSGAFRVTVDANDDGDVSDPVDRTIPVTAAEGPVSVPFDGRDGTGAPIPSSRSVSFQVIVDRIAEIHFTNADVELRGGIEVTRLNGPLAGRKTLYWNDTGFTYPDPGRCSTTPVLDGRAGMDSTGGVHGWDLGTCGSVGGANGTDGGWGNNRVIDDWTYVPVLVAQTVRLPGHDVRITKTASAPTARPGDVITYTITVENAGSFTYTAADPVVVNDDLIGVLDDAMVTGIPSATTGTVVYNSPVVSWAGAMAPGDKATITYSVRVNQPDNGDRTLVNAVTSDTPGANCFTGATDPACVTTVRVPALKITKTADRAEYHPGDTVGYTITIANDGEIPFTAADPASFIDDLTDVLDDAVFTVDDVTASSGTVGYTSPILSWSGPLAVGESATVSYIVNASEPDYGNGVMRNVVTGSPGAAINCVVCDVTLESRVVSLSKNVVSTTPNADGSFTIVYDVTVTGAGSAPSTYDLSDELRFGAGVTVQATDVIDLSGDTVNVGWNGGTTTSVVTGVSIDPGESDVYRMTVTATPGPATTGAATDCATDTGETGTGFRNTATVTGTGGEVTAQACAPIPRLVLKKLVRPLQHNGDGTYTVTYRIDVVNLGSAPATYDLTEALRFGTGLSATGTTLAANPAWDGGSTPAVVTGRDIQPDETHTYFATVVATVDPATAAAATDCTLDSGETGTGFLGTATLTSAGQILTKDACVAAPNVVITKQPVGDPVPGNDGTFTQVYDITVTDVGAGATRYDLVDELRFGAGAEVRAASMTNTAPGTVPVNPSWDGTTNLFAATAITIGGGVSHTYRVTATVAPDPHVTTGAAADCVVDAGETGTGFRNVATATQNGKALEADACTAPPAITVAKKVTGSVQNGDGTHTVTYEVTVANGGAGDGSYDLADSLEYGDGVTVTVAGVAGPAGTSTAWNGETDPMLAADVPIGGNTSHAYVITVTSAPPENPVAGTLDCTLDPGESGTGARNTATLMSNGVSDVATACAAFPDLSITKRVRSGSPVFNGDGTYTVHYEIDVTNAGAEATTYDLTDELLPGNGIAVVSATSSANPLWNGAGVQNVATGVGIAAGATNTYLLTVTYTVDPTAASSESMDCVLDNGEEGTGFLGRAAAVSNGVERRAEACAEATLLSITQKLAEPVRPNGNGSYTAVYDITVTNAGAGAATYDLTDRLRFGEGVRIDSVQASALDDAPMPSGSWDGRANDRLLDDALIAGEDEHVYRVTAIVTPLGTGKATDCVLDPGETGTGLRNVATLTSNGIEQEAVACEGVPAVSVRKDVERVSPRGGGEYAIDYRITVANDGATGTSYSLHDTLRFGTGTVVESAAIAGVSGWDGRLTTLVGADIPLGAGEHHTYTVSVVAAPPADARADAFDCALAQDEEGTGTLNTAAVVVNGVTTTANACAPFPGVTVTKAVLPGSPEIGPDGEVVVGYRITVTNNGTVDTAYDLDDELRFSDGDTITRATAERSAGAASMNAGWNGRTDRRVASEVPLAAGGVDTYIVSAHVKRDSARPEVMACETGGGLRNAAAVTVNGTRRSAEACAPAPADSLAVTGFDVGLLARLGGVLLLGGIVLMLVTRRRKG
ncbi:hypothetical protein Lesp02_23010 [Lentzea sp. NBRC 105346]|uniref:DUF7927 domain-containing protein n=1 Tax=Lentzea sp. NBRC 105346 TaxID=3032205 RepID=UPI00249FA5C0|nr:hypothetical protein [Lentzea sp. NBRC 105346]GLZ30111.1 hypothetical protein Lesp02_23010 [Lentzea sp. NBRC 105346]